MKPKHWFTIGAAVLLVWGAFTLYNSKLFGASDEFVQMSAIFLFGLGLTVILFTILAIVFSFLKMTDSRMALGLPDGSIRALLAFSLVLIFVCLSTFLYTRIDQGVCQNCGKVLSRATDAQLSDLKNNFVVAAEQARDKDGNGLYEQTAGPNGAPVNDLKHPLYSATYYPKPNAAAADFAKQIFTTLATIFVSVVSFYFGSSVTTSAMKAAQGPGGDKLQSALTAALADSHNTQVLVDQAKARLEAAQKELALDPGDASKQAAVTKAQSDLDKANADLAQRQNKVKEAQQAVSDAKGSASS